MHPLADQLKKHQNLIRSMVMKICGRQVSKDDLEDLVSMTNLALLDKKLAKYSADRGMELSTFIGMIAKRVAIDYMRGRRENVVLWEDLRELEVADPVLNIELRLLSAEKHIMFTTAVSMMPKKYSELVLAMLDDNFTLQGYADSKNVSIGSVYIKKMRALTQLRDILTKLQDEVI